MVEGPKEYGNLTADEADEFTSLMVFGLPNPEEVRGRRFEAHQPLPLYFAANFMGYSATRCERAFQMPTVRQMWARKLEALRQAERAVNFHTAKSIRDNEGDGSAAYQTARLKAIATLEGQSAGVNVNVQVNNDNRTISPGYVIRLPAEPSANLPGTPAQLTIEGSVTGLTDGRIAAGVDSSEG